jgi:phosphatidylserine decarboxylase
MNSTTSDDAVNAGMWGRTGSGILQEPGTAGSSPDLGARAQETSVRIVSPSTGSNSPHPSGYFDVPAPMPPASGSVARRRLFKKSSRDDYGPGTPGLLTPGVGTPGTSTPGSISGPPAATSRKRRPVFKRGKGKKGTEYTLDHPAQHDILGIVMLEIEGAVDLPKLRNCTSPWYEKNEYGANGNGSFQILV